MIKFFMSAVFVAVAVWAGAQEDYRALHEKAIVVDTHNDVLSTATIEKGLDFGQDLREWYDCFLRSLR